MLSKPGDESTSKVRSLLPPPPVTLLFVFLFVFHFRRYFFVQRHYVLFFIHTRSPPLDEAYQSLFERFLQSTFDSQVPTLCWWVLFLTSFLSHLLLLSYTFPRQLLLLKYINFLTLLRWYRPFVISSLLSLFTNSTSQSFHSLVGLGTFSTDPQTRFLLFGNFLKLGPFIKLD